MAADSIELIIVTPERQLLRETVTEVTLPGADGQLGVLPGHAPLITELGIGELTFRSKGGSQSDPIAIISGFAEVLGERVTVLAEMAERAGRNRRRARRESQATRRRATRERHRTIRTSIGAAPQSRYSDHSSVFKWRVASAALPFPANKFPSCIKAKA